MTRLAPLAALLLLPGCAGPLASIRDPQGSVPVPIPHAGVSAPAVPLKACVEAPSSDARNYYRQALSGVFAEITLDAPDCDILISGWKTDSPFLRGFEVRELAGGNFLFQSNMNFGVNKKVRETERAMAEAVKTKLQPDGALYKSIRRRAGTLAAAGPSASASSPLTKEDVAAAVATAMKQQRAPEAVPAPAPAGPRLPPVSKPVIFSSDRPHDLAVIVGVESYSDIATKAPYAERDAEAFKAHVRALGVPERNIVLLTGPKASRSALVKNVEGWLPRMAKPGSRVYFYFSGHGAPDPRNGTSYLVPWDGDPNFLDATGYPVNELYKRLGELPASQVLVALDSCFSGAGGRSVLPTGARPLVGRLAPVAVPAKLTVLTASASNEISGSLDDKGHGAFTWFLLEGLNAGKRSAKELHAYLTPKVQDESRRLNRDQTPQLLGADAALR